MPEVLILEFSGVTEADYASISGHLGIDVHTGEGDWPPGLLSHAAGAGDHGTFIIAEVWNSRADQAAFLDSRLGAALAAAGVTTVPKVLWVPLMAYHTPEPDPRG